MEEGAIPDSLCGGSPGGDCPSPLVMFCYGGHYTGRGGGFKRGRCLNNDARTSLLGGGWLLYGFSLLQQMVPFGRMRVRECLESQEDSQIS